MIYRSFVLEISKAMEPLAIEDVCQKFEEDRLAEQWDILAQLILERMIYVRIHDFVWKPTAGQTRACSRVSRKPIIVFPCLFFFCFLGRISARHSRTSACLKRALAVTKYTIVLSIARKSTGGDIERIAP